MGGIIPGQARQLRQVASQGVNFLGVDWITLEGHGGGADLLSAEWLMQFAEDGRLQYAQVEGKFIERTAQPGQGAQHPIILLAGIYLGGDPVERQA